MQDEGRPGDAPPNIVVVMADQHRADVLGCAGDPVVRTPSVDRLAAEGAIFSRVSCQGPLCMPARASLLTERYVRDHGVYTNWAEVDPEMPTQPRAMQDAGYHTVAIGKTHLSRHGDHGAGHVDELAHLLQQYGFSEVHETGDKFDLEVSNAYQDHLRDAGSWEAYRAHMIARSYHGENERGGGASQTVPTWDATPLPLPVDDYIDVWHGRYAADWISSYTGTEPFFLFVGFPGPHDPWDAPSEAVASYRDAEIPMPTSTRRPDSSDAGEYGRLLEGMLALSCSDTMDESAIAGMRRAYYAAVTLIDEGLGRILAALERTGRLDNTWVVYTSDHGEMGGDHSLLSKCLLYRQAVHVPLVIRPPGGIPARHVDDLVEHVDLPATLREIGRAPGIEASEGRSLLGYLTSDDPAARPVARPVARDVAVSENWGFASFETAQHRLVVDEDRHAPVQLFDLAEDPTEDRNVVADPSQTETLEGLLADVVEPFLRTPPVRPHPSPFA